LEWDRTLYVNEGGAVRDEIRHSFGLIGASDDDDRYFAQKMEAIDIWNGGLQGQTVRGMADGYIVAFRFFKQERYNTLTQNFRSLGLNHTRSTGFILIRHDIIKPVRRTMFSFRTGAPSYTRHTLYSLYVDLEIDFANSDDIAWAQRLREQRPQALEEGGIFDFETFESGENVINFCKARKRGLDTRQPVREFAYLNSLDNSGRGE